MQPEQLQALVELSLTMIWRAGPDGTWDDFDSAWLDFTGRRHEQERGDGWKDGVHPDDATAFGAAYSAHFERRQPFAVELRLRRFDGRFRRLLVRGGPYLDGTGAFAGFVGSCLDVEDGLAREDPLGADELFDRSLDNVCVAGLDGYFKRVNPSWTRTLGWTADELMSRPSLEFVHPDDRAATLAGRGLLQAGTEMGALTNRYLCKDGGYRWLEWRSVAHPARGFVYAVARDVTELKATAARLREAQQLEETLRRQLTFADRMASVGTLAAGMGHEINNPLAVVSGSIGLLLEELRAADDAPLAPTWLRVGALARDVQAAAERIRKIVLGLKTFARAEEERPAVIDVRALLELAISLSFNEIRQRGRLVKELGDLPPVVADDGRLGQVFINLLMNAAQSLPEGGGQANEVRVVTWTNAAGRAVIEVRDTGVGIPGPLLGRVFDPFFTTKAVGVGTGLGLSICQTIVIGLGGQLTVTSEVGRGSTFRVVLPAAATVPREAQPLPTPQPASSGRATVLVIDDEPSVGAVLGRMLRVHDVTVLTDAKEGLALLGAGKRFDIILSDLMMPGMSGMDFHDELLRRFPDVAARVVFISGGAFTPHAKDFLDRVVNKYIEKPFDSLRVRELVERSVGAA